MLSSQLRPTTPERARQVLVFETGALAALAGAAVVVIADRLQLPIIAATTAGAALCFEIRFLAIRPSWPNSIARSPGFRLSPGSDIMGYQP
jgi:uncharacterized membrane protein YeiH